MKLHILIRFLLLCLLLVSQSVKSDVEFIVSDIQVKGLQRISEGTVFNYLPVNVGERFSLSNVGPAIKALFKTGFFKDVSLEREGSALIVNVVERPSIAKIIFEGNKDISKDDLTKALDKIGLSEGKIFDKQVLDKVELELKRQYLSHGKYSLKIKTEVANLTRNRVGIRINISEGRVTKIKEINIVGNKAFDDKILLKKLELNTTNLLSFYSKDDQYSKQKLQADLETLRSYYLDRGYINFTIESTQVAITPDKKDIYVTINVKEGAIYKLEKVKLTGNLVVKPDELIKLMTVGPGETFSRKNATETSKAIQDRLGDDGYAFANVNMVPEIHEANKTVDMAFFVDPGKRAYVRRINYTGNTKTRDEVLRREMRQMESSWASSSKIERSKTRLERLGYFETVNVETPPVPGTADQLDVNYTVVEKSSGNLSAGIGFSQVQGIVINANLSQDNVFGSGKRVNLAFNNSDYLTSYQFGFFNPYFTTDGVSLGYNLGYTDRNAGQINIANYSTTVANAGLDLGVPLNEFDQIRFGLDLKHTNLKTGTNSSKQINDFIDKFNDPYLTLAPSIGWTHDTLNRAIFPSSGGQQRLSGLITIPGISDLEYYKLSYKHQEYFPLSSDFTFRLLADIAYGDGYGKTDQLPFFENYYGGGTGSVRGFKNNTLGPRDTPIGNTKRQPLPFGGSTKIVGSAELFFPVPFLQDVKSVRLGVFFDAGRIQNGFGFNRMKYAAGLSGEWLSPFGALSVSAAVPLNADKKDINQPDQTQPFQFNFGQNF
ncbi:outer membrane protein assembly factor BamA [Methyloglobulus sp.]|uniref:outer membrane protein assembly factor BamA n=1 Tax=Methyloglobulus sp. TaxID=2518622 RepID=UPI0032B7CD5C